MFAEGAEVDAGVDPVQNGTHHDFAVAGLFGDELVEEEPFPVTTCRCATVAGAVTVEVGRDAVHLSYNYIQLPGPATETDEEWKQRALSMTFDDWPEWDA